MYIRCFESFLGLLVRTSVVIFDPPIEGNNDTTKETTNNNTMKVKSTKEVDDDEKNSAFRLTMSFTLYIFFYL